tara:strand:+ start:4198 stop:5139 length:942 start_codon:yes stop_codon:yes gene_type:complete
MKKGIDLGRFILNEERKHLNATGSLSLGLEALSSASKVISSHVRRAGLEDIIGRHGTVNGHNEEVQKLDVIANNLLIQHLSGSGQFFALASEENDTPIYPEEGKEAHYIICFDPLDGSSNIDVNISIGTIFSIHRKIKGDETDFYQQGKNQVAAGYIIYGTSTMFVYSTGNGVNGFTLDPMMGLFLLSHPGITLEKENKIYSVNEGNFNNWDEDTQKSILNYKENHYKARYVGSMVADVHRTLLKGGVFLYPGDKENPDGKLRLLYEASPMAYLFHQAGGVEYGTNDESILEIKPNNIHQRVPVKLGDKSFKL